jgi:hypothetical protein
VLATKALAGRLAVAQPSGAWIGGNRRHDSTWSKECKALPETAFQTQTNGWAALTEIVFIQF